MVTGVFLYYPDAAYLQETRAALRRLVDVSEIEADADIVSNLIPDTLQRDVKSWLILQQPDRDQELLILPFPDKNHLELLSDGQEGFSDPVIMELSAVIKMFVYNDFYRFSELFRESKRFRRFQYLHIDVSLRFLLDPEKRQQQHWNVLCQETSRNIEQKRIEVFHKAIRTTNSTNSKIFVELDKVFLTENSKLFEHLTQQGFGEVVPEIVKRFWNIMDGETMRFLITAETVREFADKYSPANFDYSAPGCGLWKAVERELNLSLVLYLRRKAGIIENVNRPWKGSQGISGEVPILTGKNHSEDLNQRETEDQTENLKGIMLGPMKFMCEWGHCNSVREKLEDIFSLNDPVLDYLLGQRELGKRSRSQTDTLPKHLDQIIKLRNGHAHISAMSQKQFKKLRHLVLPSAHKPQTCLVKILELKKEVLEYWENKGDCFTNCMSVTTEDKRTVDFSLYNRMNVKYNTDESTKLVATRKAKLVATHRDSGKDLCIATFDKIEDANAALEALVEAADLGEQSWNAREFKNTLVVENLLSVLLEDSAEDDSGIHISEAENVDC